MLSPVMPQTLRLQYQDLGGGVALKYDVTVVACTAGDSVPTECILCEDLHSIHGCVAHHVEDS